MKNVIHIFCIERLFKTGKIEIWKKDFLRVYSTESSDGKCSDLKR